MVLMSRKCLEFGGLLVIWINGFHYGLVAGQTSQSEDCILYPVCSYVNATELKQCTDILTNVEFRYGVSLVSGSGTYFRLSFRTVEEESGLNSYIGTYFLFICFVYLFILYPG